jgi:CRP-like cAMP-binding protein
MKLYENEGLRIPFKLTHQELANLTGGTLSKMLAELKNDQTIDFRNQVITILKLEQMRKM